MSTVLAKMAVEIAANTAQFNKKIAETEKGIMGFSKTVKDVASALGIAFAVNQIKDFGIEISKLAGEAEGVSSAFNKLPGSVRIMNQLRQATESTVSDLKLMKVAVSAFNNNVPLENLAEILNFVDRTADATGQSFDELADTIIKDIGKGSAKGLNELGLSLETIKKRGKEIGFLPSVLEEIRRKSDELGEISSKTADSYDRQAASVENLKQSWGAFINSMGVSGFLDKMSFIFDMMSGRKQTGTPEQVEKAMIAFKAALDKAKEEGNREDIVKWTLAIAKLTSEYGLLKDKALEPTTKAIKAEKKEVKQVTEAYKALAAEKSALTPSAQEGTVDASGKLVSGSSLTGQVNSAAAAIKTVGSEFKPVANEIIDISGMVAGGIIDIADAFGQAASGSINFGDAIIRSLVGFAQQFGAILIAAGVGKIAFDKFSGPAMIVAGGALVALSSAVKGVISNRPRLSGRASEPSSNFSILTPNSLFYENGSRQPNIFLEARGTSLVAVTAEQTRKNGRIRANSRPL